MKQIGVDEEFLGLLNSHQGIVYKVSKAYSNNEEERRDLFQDIVFQLWKSYPSFKHEAQFSTWMYRIALNTAISGLRKIKARPSHQIIDEEIENKIQTPDTCANEERVQFLYKAIRSLTEVDRALILLYLDDMSYDQMADALGLTKTNIGVRLNRIKGKLEKEMKKYGA
jgi:RNA polymerase sigma factor (sigma-70 family)